MNITSNITIDLSGKVALITGGTRGIGKAIAKRFVEAGASVILTGTKAEEISRLNSENSQQQISYLPVDFTDEESVASFLKAVASISKIDILINNAGVNKIAANTETTQDDFNFLNNVNFKAPYLICREVSRLMKAHGYGRIVNITSIWSVITRPGRSLYTATKYAIAGLTKTLAIELAAYNILVNSVGPGFTMTELTTSTNSAEEIERMTQMIPAKRFAQPLEIANLVLFLSSDLNSYITAQNIIIDGGYTNV